ncbi:MAG: hypothetical protein M1834_006264 [Cirrosporium novae-zelandiae]|nr:MAG: hypothetical protein M1834_006264 [Cirrosporium novae-zelandiae]
MAAVAVLPTPAGGKHNFTPIIIRDKHTEKLTHNFDPKKHVAFEPPEKVWQMIDIGFPHSKGVSPVAVSEPFRLFSAEAIQEMRNEVLSDEIWNNHRLAPFVYDAWKSPEVLAIVSKIAGVELVPEMDFEIGHINISVKSEEQRAKDMAVVKEKAAREADEGVSGCPWEDDETSEKSVVGWHTDSYPFVCVLMLSDCTAMIGGETALKTGTGEIKKVRGPQVGCAAILQGRYIEHQALPAFNQSERITMVTSFRPRSPSLPDDTVLTTVRPISDLSELYYQFSEYRLEILEERIRTQLKNMREKKQAGKKLNTVELKDFLRAQEVFLAHMNKEMVEEGKVTKGMVDDSHLLDKGAEKRAKKRQRAL